MGARSAKISQTPVDVVALDRRVQVMERLVDRRLAEPTMEPNNGLPGDIVRTAAACGVVHAVSAPDARAGALIGIAPAGQALPASGSIADVIRLIESASCGTLSQQQRTLLCRRDFSDDCTHVLLLGSAMDKSYAKNLVKKLTTIITTTTRRQIATASGYYFDGRLVGTEARQRPSDLYFVLSLNDPALLIGKVYSADLAPIATKEWELSTQLDGSSVIGRDRIVTYSNYFDVGGHRMALIMPFYIRTLEQLVQHEFSGLPTPAWLLKEVVLGILEALTVLHALGTAHCDVKPDNVMFTSLNRAVLIDLGSATTFGSEITESAPASVVMDHGDVSDAQIDLVGLASTIWITINGRGPPCTTVTDLAEAAQEVAVNINAFPVNQTAMQAIVVILRSASADQALTECTLLFST